LKQLPASLTYTSNYFTVVKLGENFYLKCKLMGSHMLSTMLCRLILLRHTIYFSFGCGTYRSAPRGGICGVETPPFWKQKQWYLWL